MAKRIKSGGRSASRGNAPSPYTKRRKVPYPYPWERRLSGGNLQEPANQSFTKGLAIHSRTELTYRLTDKFQIFQALVGIDPAMGENGNVELVVVGNGKQLFRKTLTGRDEAAELKIDVRGVSRLTILVDFGEQLDIGDHLLLCNARLTK